MEKFNKQGVEIFSVGTWNDIPITHEDLNQIVQAFEETRNGIEPHLKLGHNKEQNLLAKDGLPSAGWVDKLYIKGNKLVADFKDIPKKIYQLLENKAYKKVSCEMFFNVKINDKKYPKLLTAVSLLGADTPAVMNLDDILALYSVEKKDCEKMEFEYDIKGKESTMSKTENEIKLEHDLENQKKQFTAEKEKAEKLAQEKAEADKELKELKEFKAKAEKEKIEQELKLAEEKTKNFCKSLVTEKIASPAMEPMLFELLSDKKEFSVKSGEKELKTKEEILKEVLTQASKNAQINKDETTQTGEFAAKDAKEMDEKIKKMMDEKKISYSAAYKQVMKEKKG